MFLTVTELSVHCKREVRIGIRNNKFKNEAICYFIESAIALSSENFGLNLNKINNCY